MRAESPLPRGVGLLLAATLLTTGCARWVPHPGPGGIPASHPSRSASPALRSTSGDGHPSGAFAVSSPEASDDVRLFRRRGTMNEQGSAVATSGPDSPSGWPHLDSSEELLAPFLACASPAAFVELQRGADMRRLVAALDDWSAVRLGALGPLGEDAAEVLSRKRASFLVSAAERYGVARAEVFALFILHAAFNDELRHLLQLLARDKQLGETLGRMPTVREELRRRGLPLTEYPDRGEHAGDVLRGLGRAGRDALSSTAVSDGARYQDLSAKRGQLPPPYQHALDEVEKALMEQHYAPGSVGLGSFDHLTFGVPLGFYHLAAGTGQGASSLAQGRYEQATRELAPAALMVVLYAGGRGASGISEALGTGGRGQRLQVPALDLAGLKAVVDRLSEQLGHTGMHDVLRYIQARRDAGLLVAEWGEIGAVALHEARGNVPKAQAWLSEARSQRGGPTSTTSGTAKRSVDAASRAHEAAGGIREALEAKLLQAELEAPGPRLPRDVPLLNELRPQLTAPPLGVREGSALWGEYVKYRERRLAEIEGGAPVEGPLRWEGYQQMRGLFARGLEFERLMVSRLRADAALPRAQRQWLKDFDAPRIETHVGVAKADAAGIRYADVLVIEERPHVGQPPRVETFSFKSRDLTRLGPDDLRVQMEADASDALRYYGGSLNIRRPALMLEVEVQRVRLIYQGGAFKPREPRVLGAAMKKIGADGGAVEVLFQ